MLIQKKKKDDFKKQWEELVEKVKDANLSINRAFRDYMYIIRSQEDITGSEISLKKFYSADKYKRLKIKIY